MILFFSGTGNSEYIAYYLQDKLNDEIIDLKYTLKKEKMLDVTSSNAYVLITPIYISIIPRIIEDLLIKSSLKGNDKFYFIETCAGSGSSAAYYSAKRICKALNKTFMGIKHFSMPQNYLMYFNTEKKEANKEKFLKAISFLPEVEKKIKKQEYLDLIKPSFIHKVLAKRIMVKLFEKILNSTKKFYVTDKCISCGLCQKNCPINAIIIKNGKPIWIKKKCIHCTSCINRCPNHAIEYGKKTKNKNRYVAIKYKK